MSVPATELYWIKLFASNNEDDPGADETAGILYLNILGIYSRPEAVGSLQRMLDGSGVPSKARRILHTVTFEPFQINVANKDKYNSHDNLVELDYLLTLPYIQIYDTNFPTHKQPSELETADFPKTLAQYSLPRVVTYTLQESRSVNDSDGTVELEITFEDKLPTFLSKPTPFEPTTDAEIGVPDVPVGPAP